MTPAPSRQRRRHTRRIGLVTVVAIALAVPSSVVAHDPPGMGRFMQALGEVESNGRYDVRNTTTGAIGKYQILPSNWPGWAARYAGSSRAAPTPANQERVARGKVRDLFAWLGNWPRVAHWWLTGSGDPSAPGWSAFSRRYVSRIVGAFTWPTVSDASARIAYAGPWSTAAYRGYDGRAVHYATQPGASATFWFTGRSITWIGPVGPTRGTADIWIDGQLVRTVSLRSASFVARRVVYAGHWPSTGLHEIRIAVAGRGRGPIAIDQLLVG